MIHLQTSYPLLGKGMHSPKVIKSTKKSNKTMPTTLPKNIIDSR